MRGSVPADMQKVDNTTQMVGWALADGCVSGSSSIYDTLGVGKSQNSVVETSNPYISSLVSQAVHM